MKCDIVIKICDFKPEIWQFQTKIYMPISNLEFGQYEAQIR